MAPRFERVEAHGASFLAVVPESIGWPGHTLAEFADAEPYQDRFLAGLGPGDVVVDAGAQFGGHALPALALGAAVVAYEPNPVGAECLAASVRANGWERRFYLRRAALWDDTEYDRELARAVWGPSGPVLAATLDSDGLLRAVGCSRIKVDVEGAEMRVLFGAAELVAKYLPDILIEDHEVPGMGEVSRYPARIGSGAAMRKFLGCLGYRIEVDGSRAGQRFWWCTAKWARCAR